MLYSDKNYNYLGNGSLESKIVEQLAEERRMNKEKANSQNNKYLIGLGFALSIFSMLTGPVGFVLMVEEGSSLFMFSLIAAAVAYLLMGGVAALTGALKWSFHLMLNNIWTGGFSPVAWALAIFLMLIGFIIGVMRFVVLPIRYAIIYKDESRARAECVAEYFRNNPKTVKQKVCIRS